MSRYLLQPINSNHEVVVGWDNQLETYFVQVLDAHCEGDEPPVFWAGCCRAEIPSVDAMADLVLPYAVLPQDARAQLQQDYEMRRPPQVPDGLGELAAALDQAARRNGR